ncbi:Glycosyltransferase family 23 (GT23) domain [Cinara cedri]|uniref:Glycosyltransferase family 23 (GT23) domain n=1 Tax=Cinara cedri TaxID=506608 RepID=A0A5E4LZN2_9HEMI|nr:Glycosyltransferase family 23 (GT23) domain [Cinara cedri]
MSLFVGQTHISCSKILTRVHIRRTDKGLQYLLQNVDKYMYHVEQYYRMRKLDVDKVKRLIYLESEGMSIYARVKTKYPEYEVIGVENIMENGRDFDQSIYNNITDVHFLSPCDFIICTFLSNVCRMVYEMTTFFYPNASAMFRSLDEVYNYSRELHQLYVCVAPRHPDYEEIELKKDDQICWNSTTESLERVFDRIEFKNERESDFHYTKSFKGKAKSDTLT